MTKEILITPQDGWMMTGVTALLTLCGMGGCHQALSAGSGTGWTIGILSVIFLLLALFSCGGYFTLQPNEAGVLLMFGHYKGTIRQEGFCWINPLNSVRKVSLRARNLNGEKLKVNDKTGNPIEIANVIIWRVRDTARAIFDVDNYAQYITTQSETALRHLASLYAYDHAENELSLRGSINEVSEALRKELQDHLEMAGIEVLEARLTHLAYAPEIAMAMLRRQQADAVIAAREKIVHGAVSMVEMALKELAEKQVISLDEERKAAMVSNLLVVLCAEAEVQPVINTGTLYT